MSPRIERKPDGDLVCAVLLAHSLQRSSIGPFPPDPIASHAKSNTSTSTAISGLPTSAQRAPGEGWQGSPQGHFRHTGPAPPAARLLFAENTHLTYFLKIRKESISLKFSSRHSDLAVCIAIHACSDRTFCGWGALCAGVWQLGVHCQRPHAQYSKLPQWKAVLGTLHTWTTDVHHNQLPPSCSLHSPRELGLS